MHWIAVHAMVQMLRTRLVSEHNLLQECECLEGEVFAVALTASQRRAR